MRKSEWKRRIKDKVQNKIKETIGEKLENKAKLKNGKRRQVGKKEIHTNM